MLLGLDPGKRTSLVHGMLHRPRGDAAGYWLQLGISAALATLGLALDSTAVVIGAMLIAPLMRPIVELAMGLATGSTPLAFRTGVRAIASVVVVVIASCLFAWLLPFHEVTSELLARTAPSILDLFVAAACALAGAYAVVIASSDAATTAAGTSIGISLVPPLCTAGYGLSTGDWDMAIGAALLFTANVTGIIVVASALFVIVGFGQVNIREEERSLDDDVNVGAATRIGRVVSTRGTRLGATTRIVLPLVLLGAIAFPLLKAVDAMSRRSTVKQRIAELMRRSNGERIVQYSLDQASRPVVLRVVVVGDPADARALEQRLTNELKALGEHSAAVSVWAVSDATAVSALSARLDDVPGVLSPPAAPPALPLEARVRLRWPRDGGKLLAVWTSESPHPRVRVSHLGPEIGPAAREILAAAVALEGTVVVVEEDALSPIAESTDRLAVWLPSALLLVSRAADFPDVHFCVTTPAAPARRARPDSADELARRMIADEAALHRNVNVAVGERWSITAIPEECPTAPP